tara:strand:- start:3 stop:566 length:564 start_codon:yes stop_codon:yes gene_type:complete
MNIPYHGKYEWLPILYTITKDLNPKKVVEFGPGAGYTTVTMAKALKDLNSNTIINSYDIWMHEYWGDKQNTLNFFKSWDVMDCVNLKHLDFYDWIKLSKKEREFDLLYFDINNNGKKLLDLYSNVKHNIVDGSIVLFEGGSRVRDEHGATPGVNKMNDVKNKIGYEVLTADTKYSLSIIYNRDIYEF